MSMMSLSSSVEMSVKMDVLGSMLSGKMVFENGKCRTLNVPNRPGDTNNEV